MSMLLHRIHPPILKLGHSCTKSAGQRTKLILKCHDHLDSIQTVHSEVIDEVSLQSNLEEVREGLARSLYQLASLTTNQFRLFPSNLFRFDFVKHPHDREDLLLQLLGAYACRGRPPSELGGAIYSAKRGEGGPASARHLRLLPGWEAEGRESPTCRWRRNSYGSEGSCSRASSKANNTSR